MSKFGNTKAYGAVSIGKAVDDAASLADNIHATPDQRIAAATLLVMLDIRSHNERLTDIRDCLSGIERAIKEDQ